MRIAVLTVHRAFNMGAMLQAWALKRVLERYGHQVEMPECNEIGMITQKPFRLRPYVGAFARLLLKGTTAPLRQVVSETIALLRYRSFIRRNLNSVPCAKDELFRYDLIVVGSDQVWNQEIMEDSLSLFLGEDIPERIPVVGYALSMGDSIPEGTSAERFRKAVNRFSSLTVREGVIQSYIKGLGFNEPRMVLDPTLLLEAKDYGEIESKCLVNEPYLFVYYVGEKNIWDIAYAAAKRLGVKRIVYSRGTLGWSPKLKEGQSWGDVPPRFLSYVRYAKAVVASSFHGTVFPVIYGKPFISITGCPKERIEDSRPATLLTSVGLRDRLFHVTDSVDAMMDKLEEVVTKPKTANLSSQRKECLAMLDEMTRKGFV